jgi:hypothetical protein
MKNNLSEYNHLRAKQVRREAINMLLFMASVIAIAIIIGSMR